MIDIIRPHGFSVEQIQVAGNRGPCGGVNMSLEAVRQVLDIVDGREPVYASWPIVHNKPVMRELEARGLVVVDAYDQAPLQAIMFDSAHGVPRVNRDIARQRGYAVVDGTCQLVTKEHIMARNAELAGQYICYIGTRNHPETLGVMGEVAPENATLFVVPSDVAEFEFPKDKDPDGADGVIITQTTLSKDDVKEVAAALRRKFPSIPYRSKFDICYAADNRQDAAKDLVKEVDLLTVVGSQTSHNTTQLRIIGERSGIPSYMVDTAEDMRDEWFTPDIRSVGITSGASVEERYLDGVLGWFGQRGVGEVVYRAQVKDERSMTFKLPKESIDMLRGRYYSIGDSQ